MGSIQLNRTHFILWLGDEESNLDSRSQRGILEGDSERCKIKLINEFIEKICNWEDWPGVLARSKKE
jgi:hypothetical protein